MKKKHRFLLVFGIALSLFIVLVWFQSHRLLKSPQVQKVLTQKIQAITEGTLHYQGLETDLFPQPTVTLIQPQLELSNGSLALQAEKIRFEFNILPIACATSCASFGELITGPVVISINGIPNLSIR